MFDASTRIDQNASMRTTCVVLLAVVAGCSSAAGTSSSSSSGGVTDAGPPLTASGYCEAIVDFFCPFYVRCGRMAVPDEATCRGVFLESCNARYEPRYVDLADAGLLTISTAGISRCRAHLSNVECARQPRDLDGECAFMWEGHQVDGGSCGLDVESLVCSAGTACVLGLDFCGDCRPLSPPGGPCGTGATTCGPDSTCLDTVCVRRIAAGDSCADGGTCAVGTTCNSGTCQGPVIVNVGDACSQVRRCPYKSQCVGGTCVETVMQGQACGANVGCASGWCDNGTCVATLPNGAACTSSDQCASYDCANGTCDALPDHCF